MVGSGRVPPGNGLENPRYPSPSLRDVLCRSHLHLDFVFNLPPMSTLCCMACRPNGRLVLPLILIILL